MPGRVLHGPQPKGGQPHLDIRPTRAKPGDPPNPDHQPDANDPRPKVQKRSTVTVGGTNLTGGTMNIGLRLNAGDTVRHFEIRYGPPPPRPLTLRPAPQRVVDDLETGLGKAPDEQWVAYQMDLAGIPPTDFETTLVLKPHTIPDNGFRVVTVAINHDGKSFAREDYLYGVSVIPGKNSQGYRIAVKPGAPRPTKPSGGRPAKGRTPAKGRARRRR